jgi:hypothetical protein
MVVLGYGKENKIKLVHKNLKYIFVYYKLGIYLLICV